MYDEIRRMQERMAQDYADLTIATERQKTAEALEAQEKRIISTMQDALGAQRHIIEESYLRLETLIGGHAQQVDGRIAGVLALVGDLDSRVSELERKAG